LRELDEGGGATVVTSPPVPRYSCYSLNIVRYLDQWDLHYIQVHMSIVV